MIKSDFTIILYQGRNVTNAVGVLKKTEWFVGGGVSGLIFLFFFCGKPWCTISLRKKKIEP